MSAKHFCALFVGAFLCFSASNLYSDEPFTDSLETAFVDGGEIEIKLSAGQHTISKSNDNTIRVYWRVRDEDTHKVDADTQVNGTKAVVDIDGPMKNFESVIEVPMHSDIIVRVSAGELFVGNLEGDRDIKLRAGDLNIEVGSPEDYAQVDGSLWVGDLDAGPFNANKSGLFRSLKWEGEGSHSLRFKLRAGDVELYQAGD